MDGQAVLSSLEAFSAGYSLGFFQLRAQHLLDAIKRSCTPDALACLDNLTRFILLLLSGKVDVSMSSWLSGAPLIALNKKSGGVRPFAVGEVIRHLVSRICCTAVKPYLKEVFLPYGQVGVGVCE